MRDNFEKSGGPEEKRLPDLSWPESRTAAVADFGELKAVKKVEGQQAVVRSTGFVYQVINGCWVLMGRHKPRKSSH